MTEIIEWHLKRLLEFIKIRWYFQQGIRKRIYLRITERRHKKINRNKYKTKKTDKITHNANYEIYILQRKGPAGLFSLVRHALGGLHDSKLINAPLYIDFATFPTEFSSLSKWMGTYNAWEYFFEQPNSIENMRDLCARAIYSDLGRTGTNYPSRGRSLDFVNSKSELEILKKDFDKLIKFNSLTLEFIEGIKSEIGFDPKTTCAVVSRGVSYPIGQTGHSLPINTERFLVNLEKFIQSKNFKSILISTHSQSVRSQIEKATKGQVLCVPNFRLSLGKLSLGYELAKRLGFQKGRPLAQLDYLTEIVLAGQAKFLFGEVTNGSAVAAIMGGSAQEQEFLFEGNY